MEGIVFGGGGGGVSSDEVTATLYNVLAGKTALTTDTDDEIGTGKLPKIFVLATTIPDTSPAVSTEGTLDPQYVVEGEGGGVGTLAKYYILESAGVGGTLLKSKVLTTAGGSIPLGNVLTDSGGTLQHYTDFS